MEFKADDIVLIMTTFLFCSVIGLFIIPTILDRVVFYIPKLIVMSGEGTVYKKSVFITVGEVFGWLAVIVGVYGFFFFVYPDLFWLVFTSHMAISIWILSGFNILIRYINFNKKIKREFYYTAYMKYISPEALQAYLAFLEDIDNLYNEDLEALRKQKLPYMHLQALDRKISEKKVKQKEMDAADRIKNPIVR